MTTYKSPGVYSEEVNSLPPAIVPVSTAVPAFLGMTKNSIHPITGENLINLPVRIGSLLEFQTIFGVANESIEISIEYDLLDGTKITRSVVSISKNSQINLTNKPKSLLYYQLQMYFANGGGPCYIVSIGTVGGTISGSSFDNGLLALKNIDEPTLIICTDACLGDNIAATAAGNAAMNHCQLMKDRFAILDTPSAFTGGVDSITTLDSGFRNDIGTSPEQRMYGAAYFPFLKSIITPHVSTSDLNSVKVVSLKKISFKTNATTGVVEPFPLTPVNGNISVVIDDTVAHPSVALDHDSIKKDLNTIYNAAVDLLNNNYMLLPPSGAIAGIYCATDNARGVWKAPGNVGIAMTTGAALKMSTDFNDELNSPGSGSGKSINAIREFTGKGTLVWGARTLNSNDLNWRFINVRREVIFIEESIQKALESFIFEPNVATTWVRAKAMTENFLNLIWRQGGLAGAKPEDAYEVQVGLGVTMTPADVAAGIMILSITIVPPRPAEVIVLRVSQKLQVS